jgi:hypothetical protein
MCCPYPLDRVQVYAEAGVAPGGAGVDAEAAVTQRDHRGVPKRALMSSEARRDQGDSSLARSSSGRTDSQPMAVLAAVGDNRAMTVRGVAWAFAALVGGATIVAGCGALSAPGAPSGASAVAVATASFPSIAPTPLAASPSPSPSPVAPSPSPSPTSVASSPTAGPELPHADVDLERYVPAKIGAVELYRLSFAGPDIASAGSDMCILLCGNEPREFAQALGIPLDRVTVALSMGEQGGIGGVAFRAKGVATDRLAAAGSAITGGVVGGGEAFPMKVAERNVWFLYRLNRGQYLIPIGDVLVFLYGEAPMTAPGQISPAGTVPPGVVALIEALPR